MTGPIVRIPWRLTVGLSMIVLAAILIGLGIWIGVLWERTSPPPNELAIDVVRSREGPQR